MAAGKGIRPKTIVHKACLLDEGPTITRLLGLTLGNTDGKIIKELLTV